MNVAFFNALKFSLLLFLIIISCSQSSNETTASTLLSENNISKADEIKTFSLNGKKNLKDLTQDEIRERSKTNSCYYALLKDSAYFNTLRKPGFEIENLFNDSLKKNNPYRNRFIVGDFMALDEKYDSRGIEEKNPDLTYLLDFEKFKPEFFEALTNAEKSDSDYNKFKEYVRNYCMDDSAEIFNFYEKVWKYKTPAIKRNFAISHGNAYAVGQKLCLCEVEQDTIQLIAQFATSSKRLEPRSKGGTIQFLPIGKRRYYYASQYRISSKNWETQRKYQALDIEHDKKLGGGNKRVTFYKGKAQLPNFLLMAPSKEYPRAMTSNGIHEVALRELTRGMLGCANSIGCIRVSDFGSKFIRWWVPQNANFFVIYRDDRYFKKLDIASVEEMLPFKNENEGNAFRAWLIKQKPLKASQLEIDSTGKFDNGYILDAYNLYGDEYEVFKNSKRNP